MDSLLSGLSSAADLSLKISTLPKSLNGILVMVLKAVANFVVVVKGTCLACACRKVKGTCIGFGTSWTVLGGSDMCAL